MRARLLSTGLRSLALAVFVAGLAAALPAVSSGATQSSFVGSIAPSKGANDLDCNGWSNQYAPARVAMQDICTDPIAINAHGQAARLIDNGWYVGHDEPSVKFISSQPGSGYSMTYYMQLPVDPTSAPTPSGSVTN